MAADQPLGAIDLFHLRAHHEMRQQGLRGNACALVLQLSGRVPTDRLRARLQQAAEAMPELRWQLRRDSRLRYVWRPQAHAPELLSQQVLAHDSGLLPRVTQLIDTPVDGAAPWHIRLYRGPERDALALRWFHPITDALGAQRLLRWLGAPDAPDPPPADKRWGTPDRLLKNADRDKLIAMARSYTEHVMKLGEVPVLSLHGARAGRSLGNMAALRLQLSERETAAFDMSLRARAKLADTSLIVWSAARLIDRLLAERGFSPPQQLVPLPLSLDPKRGAQRMFGNHLSMMMLSLSRAELRDEAAAVASLATQRRAIIRHKHDAAMLAGLRLAWPLPSPIFSWLMRRPFGGERSSLVVSNPGPIEIDEMFGVPVADAYGLPTALAAPGFQLIATRHGARRSFVMVYLDGLIERHELRAQLPQLRDDLLGRES